MPAAKAARSAANSRTATRRGAKGLVLGGVPLPIERSDVRLRPEVIARHVPPTAASLSGEKCRGPGLGPDAEDPDSGLHQGNLLPVVLRETIVRPQGAPTAAIPGQLDDSKMIANGPTARKLDKRYNRRHILFQEAVTHEARALLYERPAPAP